MREERNPGSASSSSHCHAHNARLDMLRAPRDLLNPCSTLSCLRGARDEDAVPRSQPAASEATRADVTRRAVPGDAGMSDRSLLTCRIAYLSASGRRHRVSNLLDLILRLILLELHNGLLRSIDREGARQGAPSHYLVINKRLYILARPISSATRQTRTLLTSCCVRCLRHEKQTGFARPTSCSQRRNRSCTSP